MYIYTLHKLMPGRLLQRLRSPTELLDSAGLQGQGGRKRRPELPLAQVGGLLEGSFKGVRSSCWVDVRHISGMYHVIVFINWASFLGCPDNKSPSIWDLYWGP